MIPRKYGRIINIASIAGLGGNPPEMTTLAYNTSKGAVISFTEALGCEWGKYSITVNAICPGFFPSKMTQGTLDRLGEDKLAAHAPLRRLGDDEDLKGITLLFASRRRQAHHRPVAGGRWRRQRRSQAAERMAVTKLFGVDIPFVHHLGFELMLFEGGHSEIHFEARPEHLNSFRVTHGGACMTLLDVAMAVAARSVDKEMGVVTIEMKTSFMQPARGQLSAKGRLMHRTGHDGLHRRHRLRQRGPRLRPCHRHLQVRQAPAHRAQEREPLNVISTD